VKLSEVRNNLKTAEGIVAHNAQLGNTEEKGRRPLKPERIAEERISEKCERSGTGTMKKPGKVKMVWFQEGLR